MLLNLFLYFFIFTLIMIVIEHNVDINNNIMIMIYIVVFSLISSLRGINTADTIVYADFYTNIGTSITDFSGQYVFERGFVLVNIITKSLFGSNFRMFFFFITFLNCTMITLSLKKLGFTKLIIPIALYISFYGIYFNFTVLRAGLAFSFLLYSWIIYNDKKMISVLNYLFALSLHSSVLLTIPVYFFIKERKEENQLNLKYNNRTFTLYIVWSFSILIIYLLRPERLLFISVEWLNTLAVFKDFRYGYYLNNIKFIEGVSLRIIFNILLSFIFIIFGDLGDKVYKKLLNVYLMGLTLLAVFSYFLWVERMTDFYLAVSFILLSFHLKKSNRKLSNIGITMVLLVINMLFVYRIIV